MRLYYAHTHSSTHMCVSVKRCVGESIGVKIKSESDHGLFTSLQRYRFIWGEHKMLLSCILSELHMVSWSFFSCLFCVWGFVSVCVAFFTLNHTHHRYEIYIQIQSYGRPRTQFLVYVKLVSLHQIRRG